MEEQQEALAFASTVEQQATPRWWPSVVFAALFALAVYMLPFYTPWLTWALLAVALIFYFGYARTRGVRNAARQPVGNGPKLSWFGAAVILALVAAMQLSVEAPWPVRVAVAVGTFAAALWLARAEARQ